MVITRIMISNFMKLVDVDFNPSATNVIVGKNRQGKTAILKAIRAACSGDIDASSIRVGEDKAEITLELDEINIRRSITSKGSYLDISNKDGFKMPSPQSFLNGILGDFTFNPIEFFDKKPADRKKYLLNAVKITITPERLSELMGGLTINGLDFSRHALEVIEDARKFVYDNRTVANAEVTKKKKSLEDLLSQIPEGFDPREVSEESITALRLAIQGDKDKTKERNTRDEKVVLLQKQEADINEQIAALQSKLIGVQDQIIAESEKAFDISDDLTMDAAQETLEKLEGQRDIVYTVKRSDEVRAELDQAMQKAEQLDGLVKKLTKEIPGILVSEADLPVAGLTVDGDELLINGVNIDNLSSSEQLKLGLDVVRALNHNWKVICIDGVEMLDKESFEFFLNEIKDDSYQYFVTRVSDEKGEHYITIENGAIK